MHEELSPSRQVLLRASVARITTLANQARKIVGEQHAIVEAVNRIESEKSDEAWNALRALLENAKAS